MKKIFAFLLLLLLTNSGAHAQEKLQLVHDRQGEQHHEQLKQLISQAQSLAHQGVPQNEILRIFENALLEQKDATSTVDIKSAPAGNGSFLLWSGVFCIIVVGGFIYYFVKTRQDEREVQRQMAQAGNTQQANPGQANAPGNIVRVNRHANWNAHLRVNGQDVINLGNDPDFQEILGEWENLRHAQNRDYDAAIQELQRRHEVVDHIDW